MIYRFVTKASVEERITQVCEKQHHKKLHIPLKIVSTMSGFCAHLLTACLSSTYSPLSGGKEENDAHPSGGATWSRLQDRLHVQAGARWHPEVWNWRIVQGWTRRRLVNFNARYMYFLDPVWILPIINFHVYLHFFLKLDHLEVLW